MHSIFISFHCWWQQKSAQEEDAVPAVCTHFSLTFALCVGVNVTVWTVIAQTSQWEHGQLLQQPLEFSSEVYQLLCLTWVL